MDVRFRRSNAGACGGSGVVVAAGRLASGPLSRWVVVGVSRITGPAPWEGGWEPQGLRRGRTRGCLRSHPQAGDLDRAPAVVVAAVVPGAVVGSLRVR